MTDKMEGGDKRIRAMHDILPDNWDNGAIGLAHELLEMLKPIADEGTGIDSGGGSGIADLWVTVQGVEYHIGISKSLNQLAREDKANDGS